MHIRKTISNSVLRFSIATQFSIIPTNWDVLQAELVKCNYLLTYLFHKLYLNKKKSIINIQFESRYDCSNSNINKIWRIKVKQTKMLPNNWFLCLVGYIEANTYKQHLISTKFPEKVPLLLDFQLDTLSICRRLRWMAQNSIPNELYYSRLHPIEGKWKKNERKMGKTWKIEFNIIHGYWIHHGTIQWKKN